MSLDSGRHLRRIVSRIGAVGVSGESSNDLDDLEDLAGFISDWLNVNYAADAWTEHQLAAAILASGWVRPSNGDVDREIEYAVRYDPSGELSHEFGKHRDRAELYAASAPPGWYSVVCRPVAGPWLPVSSEVPT
ncbi:hypothetical protein SAMN05444157_1607 [Frankineae bacterium MT45]|nr:hypothetical protein SAMN05444157_1607 [Frankineae bacterium MT45]